MRTALLHTLLIALVLCGATWLAGPAREGEWARQYDQVRPVTDPSGRTFEQVFAAERPELILIGDSILDSAVDAALLSELTGLSCYSFSIHGSASALWYLMLKQGVLASGHRPRFVVLTFRDLYLTVPDYRVTGPYRATLNYFDRERDPLLVDLAYDPPTNPLRDLLRRNWSLFQARDAARQQVESLLREQAIAALLGVGEQDVLAAVDRAFAREALSSGLSTRAQESAAVSPELLHYFDFEEQVERSFLPPMLRLAGAAGIQPICLRFRARRETAAEITTRGVPEVAQEMIPAYVRELDAYLEQRGVPLIDMSGEERLQIEHYADGDHLDEELGKPLFTRLLAERLRATLIR